MRRPPLDDLMRKEVEVRAGGILYRGVLLEVTRDEITLRGPTGFITVPMNRVTSVRDPLAPEKHGTPKFVDESFYAEPPETGDPKKKA